MLAETWNRNRGSRAARIVAVLIGVAMLIPTAVHADSPGYSRDQERIPILSGFVLADDGMIVLTGPPFEQGCFGEGFLEPLAKVVTNPDGSTQISAGFTDQTWVFDDEGYGDNPVDWIFGVVCPAVWAGEPAPEPLAQGQARVHYVGSVDINGVADDSVNITGILTTADGDNVKLKAQSGFDGDDTIKYGG